MYRGALPILKVLAGVQPDEDFAVTVSFAEPDGVTALPLTGITFDWTIGDFASGAATVSGGSVFITVLAAQKEAWPTGRFRITLTATDGTYTQDVFSEHSQLLIGADRFFTILSSSSPTAAAMASSIVASTLLAQIAALPDATLIAFFAGLSQAVRAAMFNSGLQAVPDLSQGGSLPASGNGAVDASGFVIKTS